MGYSGAVEELVEGQPKNVGWRVMFLLMRVLMSGIGGKGISPCFADRAVSGGVSYYSLTQKERISY